MNLLDLSGRLPSPEFIAAVEAARHRALETGGDQDDDAIRYMAETIPTYAQFAASPDQARAGGCPNCVYLGLWADRWPAYPDSRHGMIWLFDQGIRSVGGDLRAQVYQTLLHEYGHALQRDHVLDEMERRRNIHRAAAMAYRPLPRSCSSCGA